MRRRAPLEERHEERHERLGKWLQPVKEGLQGAFTTDRIAKQQREKVHDLIPSEPLPDEAHLGHLGVERLEQSMAAQRAGHEDDFSKPRRNRWLRSGRGVNVHTWMGYGAHDDLQERISETCFLSLKADFLPTLRGFFSVSYLVAHPVGLPTFW